MSMRIGDVAYLNGMEPIVAPLPVGWPHVAYAVAVPADVVIDMRPGGIIRVRKSTDCTWIEPDRAREVPNRLHGAAINAEGDAI